MGKTGCAVFSCKPRDSDSRHRFPDPDKKPELFNSWISAIGSKYLMDLPKIVVYEQYRLCKRHFRDDDFLKNRLKQTAVPSLHLPQGPESDRIHSTAASLNLLTLESYVHLTPTSQHILQPQPDSSSVAQDLNDGVSSDLPVEVQMESPQSRSSGLRTPPLQIGQMGLLKSLNVTRYKQLTPKAKFLYRQAILHKKQAGFLRKKKINFRTTLRKATKYAQSNAFQKVCSNLSEQVQFFFKSQLNCSNKLPKGRKFTINDKILSLALYKQSGSGYRFLSNIFSLPSRVTLMKLLNSIPIEPGFNSAIFDGLKESTKSMSRFEKYCFLLFDEMSVMSNLHYNQHVDRVEGFENFGDYQTENIADHVQVFMLRGVAKKWKQPIFYQFVKGGAKAHQIMQTIKEIIKRVKQAGLTVLGTICDQGTNNVSALNQLVQETKGKYLRRGEVLYDYIFEIDDEQIIPLYDPPHLLKGLRNNLLKRDISFVMDDSRKVAKWSDIEKAWLLDNFSGELRCMPKLTEFHVDKQNIRKMKVSTASQIFSHSVASTINLMAKSEYAIGEGTRMEPRATETSHFLSFVDKLFDSVNGSSNFNSSGKLLRTSVDVIQKENLHTEFWRKAIKVFDSMYCLDNEKTVVPPTIKNWKITLSNMLLLRLFLKKIGFTCFKPRFLNQDPLENFFGSIRQRGQRYVNPTCTAFGPFYKSLLVNNLVAKHSMGSNCEDDKSNILLPLQKFVQQGMSKKNHTQETSIPALVIPEKYNVLKPLEDCAIDYIGGYIVKIKLKLEQCPTCNFNILRRDDENIGYLADFIKAKELGGIRQERLKYINKNFFLNLVKIYNIVRYILNKAPSTNGLLRIIKNVLQKHINFNFSECSHRENVVKEVFNSFPRIIIFNYFNGVNNVLNGKDNRQLPNKCPNLYVQARHVYKSKNKQKY